MSYDANRIAIQTYLRTNWTTTPIRFDGTVPPVEQGEFIRMNLFDVDSQQASIGSSSVKYRHPGILLIEIYVTEQTGSGRATQLGDSIAALFRGTTVGDARFRSPTVKQIGRDESWYKVNVTCPFQRDECF